MYIAIDNEEIKLRDFVICEFYETETCFCWCADKLIVFPYTNDKLAHNIRILSTPAPIKKIQCFDGRIFLICTPHGVYKLSRTCEFAVLSKNALGMGTEFCEVLISKRNGIYLDNKQTKSSTLLFRYSTTLNATENVCILPLILRDTEDHFIRCCMDVEDTEKNLCVIGHGKKLFMLLQDTVRLVYTSDSDILDIVSVKREKKVAGLLLLIDTNVVILMYNKRDNRAFEKIHLASNIKSSSVLCAGFSLQTENVLWIVYCDESKLYYTKKELLTDDVQQTRIEERKFVCVQHYGANMIVGLSKDKELLQLSIEMLENSMLMNNNVNLRTDMFQGTDLIVDNICQKTKELALLYETLKDEQDGLRRINLYAYTQKLQVTPYIELSRLWNCCYLALHISEKLPGNSYMVFSFNSNNQNVFCMKKVTGSVFTVNMCINENRMSYYSKVNMDLITLMNVEAPWCIIKNFINCPLQNHKRKRRAKKDKTIFINTKIASLRSLIAEKDVNMAKLYEIKKIIRMELQTEEIN